jgi:kindlin 2
MQLQVGLQANVPQPSEDDDEEDDVDAALTDLQLSLEGLTSNGGVNGYHDIMTIPSLTDTLQYLRPKRFTLRGYKRHYFVLKELQLASYRCQEDAHDQLKPSFVVNLKGCEITPDVNIAHHRYGIKLSVPSAEGMSDLWLKCENVRLTFLDNNDCRDF